MKIGLEIRRKDTYLYISICWHNKCARHLHTQSALQCLPTLSQLEINTESPRVVENLGEPGETIFAKPHLNGDTLIIWKMLNSTEKRYVKVNQSLFQIWIDLITWLAVKLWKHFSLIGNVNRNSGNEIACDKKSHLVFSVPVSSHLPR